MSTPPPIPRNDNLNPTRQRERSQETLPRPHNNNNYPPKTSSLYKQKSWSQDSLRDEAWIRRKANQDRRKRRSKSVTDDDLEELKACIELGFSFDSPEMDHNLSDTFPAYGLYYSVVNNKYNTSNNNTTASSPLSSFILPPDDDDSISPIGSPQHTIVSPGENPQTVKTRLRQWAQVVACAVRQSSK